MTAAHHSGRVTESESSENEISSSSDDSLLTDEGKLSLKPYMHEPPATPSTLRKSVQKKKNQSQNPHTTVPVRCLRVRRLSVANQRVLMEKLSVQQSC